MIYNSESNKQDEPHARQYDTQANMNFKLSLNDVALKPCSTFYIQHTHVRVFLAKNHAILPSD